MDAIEGVSLNKTDKNSGDRRRRADGIGARRPPARRRLCECHPAGAGGLRSYRYIRDLRGVRTAPARSRLPRRSARLRNHGKPQEPGPALLRQLHDEHERRRGFAPRRRPQGYGHGHRRRLSVPVARPAAQRGHDLHGAAASGPCRLRERQARDARDARSLPGQLRPEMGLYRIGQSVWAARQIRHGNWKRRAVADQEISRREDRTAATSPFGAMARPSATLSTSRMRRGSRSAS